MQAHASKLDAGAAPVAHPALTSCSAFTTASLSEARRSLQPGTFFMWGTLLPCRCRCFSFSITCQRERVKGLQRQAQLWHSCCTNGPAGGAPPSAAAAAPTLTSGSLSDTWLPNPMQRTCRGHMRGWQTRSKRAGARLPGARVRRLRQRSWSRGRRVPRIGDPLRCTGPRSSIQTPHLTWRASAGSSTGWAARRPAACTSSDCMSS